MEYQPGACPFCGNTDVTLWEDDSISRYYVSCGECWTTGPDVDVRSEAIRLWNLPNKRLEDLRAEYERRNESVIKLGHVHLGQEPGYREGGTMNIIWKRAKTWNGAYADNRYVAVVETDSVTGHLRVYKKGLRWRWEVAVSTITNRRERMGGSRTAESGMSKAESAFKRIFADEHVEIELPPKGD
jgi:hypothetical protein